MHSIIMKTVILNGTKDIQIWEEQLSYCCRYFASAFQAMPRESVWVSATAISFLKNLTRRACHFPVLPSGTITCSTVSEFMLISIITFLLPITESAIGQFRWMQEEMLLYGGLELRMIFCSQNRRNIIYQESQAFNFLITKANLIRNPSWGFMATEEKI